MPIFCGEKICDMRTFLKMRKMQQQAKYAAMRQSHIGVKLRWVTVVCGSLLSR